MDGLEIPLFPLRTVLFPDGLLPLRIFEQRYLAMVRECARSESAFGVCLIVEGEEAISPVRIAPVGTLAYIVDWFTLEDGLLGVTDEEELVHLLGVGQERPVEYGWLSWCSLCHGSIVASGLRPCGRLWLRPGKHLVNAG